MNIIDLQIQSTASDGIHTPRELIQMAKDQGLLVVSITDHDTVGGVEEALKAGENFGVRVIPGIEMSVEERGAHILGYGIDHKNPELLAELEKFRQGRIEGAKKMVENLKSAGFTLEWEDVMREAGGGVIARPHLAKAVLNRPENKEKLGSISTVYDFIRAYLTNESPHYVSRTHISAQDAITLIHKVGGVAIWSHPAVHFSGNYEELEGFLKELIGWGINGLEVFSPSHTEDDIEFLQGLAVKYNLLRTAGSDFHEKDLGKKGADTDQGFVSLRSANAVGDYGTYGFSTEDIIPKLDEAVEQRCEGAA